MGFFDRFRTPELVDVPADLRGLPVTAARVHTAESMVVLTLMVDDAPAVLEAVASRQPYRLTSPDLPDVLLIPVTHGSLSPTFDPLVGWLIPLTDEVAEEIGNAVDPSGGAWEIEGINVGIVIE